VVDALYAVTVPFSVAVVVPTGLAKLVTTAGTTAEVVNVMSFPLEVPPALVPVIMK
jgi:hypothetical protein